MEKSNDSTTNIFRLVSWIICVLGFYLLFSPIITLISFTLISVEALISLESEIEFRFAIEQDFERVIVL